MNTVFVDKALCRRDGICRAVCPLALLAADAEKFPEFIDGGDLACLLCGHCVSACPHEALTIPGLAPGQCIPMDARPESQDAARQLLKLRRSIRAYRKKRISRKMLTTLLETTTWAPSAVNAQPVRWRVVEDPEKVRELAGLVADWLRTNEMYQGMITAWDRGKDMILRGAPHLVMAHASKEGFQPVEDCSIALTYLDIAAHAMGLGTCWAGIFLNAYRYHPPVKEALSLPQTHKLYAAAMLGYPKFQYHRIPPRNEVRIEFV